MPDTPGDLAKKLDTLFETVTKPDGSRYTQEEVIRGTGGVLTRVYLWKLRTGRARNPSFNTMKAIASFFGVDPSYFFESENKGIEQAQEDDLVNKIAFRSSELDKEGKQAVLQMIDYILKSQDRSEDQTERT
ncbi:MAG: helix-turn-helix transcriptional regulator [Anaerolineaceae bacterium]|nr:helix-turn-helix transcriptional regulator [Anaerolineaceae bacterium]